MKHKKKVSLNNKFFWAGLGVLAVVGVVGFATELNSVANSAHEFDNVYTYKSYNVDLKNIINEEEAAKMEPGKPINADLVVRNTGDIPMLVRIKYTDYFDEEGNPVGGRNFGDEYGKGEVGSAENYVDRSKWDIYFAENNDFWLSRMTCHYYYAHVLQPGEEIKHLDKICLQPVKQDYYRTTTDNTIEWSDSPGTTITGVKKQLINESQKALKLSATIETVQAIDPNTGNVLEEKDFHPTQEQIDSLKEEFEEGSDDYLFNYEDILTENMFNCWAGLIGQDKAFGF